MSNTVRPVALIRHVRLVPFQVQLQCSLRACFADLVTEGSRSSHMGTTYLLKCPRCGAAYESDTPQGHIVYEPAEGQ